MAPALPSHAAALDSEVVHQEATVAILEANLNIPEIEEPIARTVVASLGIEVVSLAVEAPILWSAGVTSKQFFRPTISRLLLGKSVNCTATVLLPRYRTVALSLVE